MTEFHQIYSLYRTKDDPPNVRVILDAASDSLYCCRTNLMTANGAKVKFCWWEWYLKSNAFEQQFFRNRKRKRVNIKTDFL